MPSTSTRVGALTLPVAAGALGARLEDPLLDGMIDWLAWAINDALNARLARYTGVSTTAVPTANRFPWDPLEPRGHSVKLLVPGLWAWWHEDSEMRQWSTVRWTRERKLRVLWLYEELPALTEHVRRAGLMAAVDAAWSRCSAWQLHPSYAPPSSPTGMGIDEALAGVGMIDWSYVGARAVRFGIGDEIGAPTAQTPRSGRDFPAIAGIFRVREMIEDPQLVSPTDELTDLDVTLYGATGEQDELAPVPIIVGYCWAPDGSAEL